MGIKEELEIIYQDIKKDYEDAKKYAYQKRKTVFWIIIAFITMQFTDVLSLGAKWGELCQNDPQFRLYKQKGGQVGGGEEGTVLLSKEANQTFKNKAAVFANVTGRNPIKIGNRDGGQKGLSLKNEAEKMILRREQREAREAAAKSGKGLNHSESINTKLDHDKAVIRNLQNKLSKKHPGNLLKPFKLEETAKAGPAVQAKPAVPARPVAAGAESARVEEGRPSGETGRVISGFGITRPAAIRMNLSNADRAERPATEAAANAQTEQAKAAAEAAQDKAAEVDPKQDAEGLRPEGEGQKTEAEKTEGEGQKAEAEKTEGEGQKTEAEKLAEQQKSAAKAAAKSDKMARRGMFSSFRTMGPLGGIFSKITSILKSGFIIFGILIAILCVAVLPILIFCVLLYKVIRKTIGYFTKN